MNEKKKWFTPTELLLWGVSVAVIAAAFWMFDRENYGVLLASLIGVTSLIFSAKGNPLGQLLMVVFSLMYGAISFTFAYYGEMLTYLCMTAPMAVFALISWMKNPYNGNRSEVKVNRIGRTEWVLLIPLTALVTYLLYGVLTAFDTAYIVPSTLSVATSFLAVYLTFRRSAYFAAAYAANDLILIVLWGLASLSNTDYVSVMICFIMFLINDLYGFVRWSKMQKAQEADVWLSAGQA